MSGFPFYRQVEAKDCGPTCVRMIAKFYGRHYTLASLREKSFIDREGVSVFGICEAADDIGLKSIPTKISFETLKKEKPFPLIAHWNQNHFIVVYKITNKHIFVADPARDKLKLTYAEFKKGWASITLDQQEAGICILLQPTPKFSELDGEKTERNSFTFLAKYLFPYKKLLIQVILGLVAASILQLLFPFLAQSIVDTGIQYQNISFINLILIAQVIVFLSQLSIEFIRGWILLHLSTRINVSLISDFLIKLLKLPVSYFESRVHGDIIQRIQDHGRIRDFLTNGSLSSIFSIFNLLIFGLILFIYSLKIFLVFIVFSILFVVWVMFFLKSRRTLESQMFTQQADNQSKILQIINGLQEIKLTGSENIKRWEWESIQARMFKINIKNLSLEQYQTAGASFINQLKNILISFIAAKSVIQGEMTLGMMLAVQYIIGQLNGPLLQLVSFIQQAQYAKISLDRISEIHNKEEEEKIGLSLHSLPKSKTITFRSVLFQYGGPASEKVIDSINITIPVGKVTAIVGSSGSGKTTLLRLLLKFYTPQSGEIRIGDTNLNNISAAYWRSKCGVVMQDGYLFSDSILNNIVTSEETMDKYRLIESAKIVCIDSFIEQLPLGYSTNIGNEGMGLSQGQKQRILLARAVYKNPDFLFLDEATNALDANNEANIVSNLENFMKGRTSVIVAHRLSTVKKADNIIVLDKGRVMEEGTHESLIQSRGLYYELVKNQIEIDR